MNKSRMKIVNINGTYVLISEDGWTIHTEKTLEKMWKYVSEQFAQSKADNLIEEDFSQLYRDERVNYVTEKQLEKEFSEMSEDEQNGRTAAEYISDCMSENGGTLTAING